MLDEAVLREFGERGFVVVPGVVAAERLADASAAVDQLVAADPPPDGHTGHTSTGPVSTPAVRYWRPCGGALLSPRPRR